MLILITGASGSGTSTLGAALAKELGIAHLDADDYYWLPTTPPFTAKRDRADGCHRFSAMCGRSKARSWPVPSWSGALSWRTPST